MSDDVKIGGFTREYLHEYCNGLDASMFSGDAFVIRENRESLRFYILRWLKELDNLEAADYRILIEKLSSQPKNITT